MHRTRSGIDYCGPGVLMNCNMKKVEGKVYACANEGCGRTARFDYSAPSKYKFPCQGTAAGKEVPSEVAAYARELAALPPADATLPDGPGTKLRLLLAEAGIVAKNCNCAATETRMNNLGVEGCRTEIESVCAEIVANAKNWGMQIPEGFDPLPYVRQLVEMAIERAEVAEAEKTTLQIAPGIAPSVVDGSTVVEA